MTLARKLSPEHRAAISAGKKGRPRPDVSERQRGRKRPPEVGASISAAKRAKPRVEPTTLEEALAGRLVSRLRLAELLRELGFDHATYRVVTLAAKAGRIVPATPNSNGTGARSLYSLPGVLEQIAALPACRCPGCGEPAVGAGGGCGAQGHSRVGKPHTQERRARIADAKRGKPRPDLAGRRRAPEVVARSVATRKRSHPVRQRACRDCGVPVVNGARCRSCAARERWASREEGDRRQALGPFSVGREIHRRERNEHFDSLKGQMGLLDTAQVAASYGTATNVITRMVAAGALAPARLEVGPHPRPLFAVAEVKRFERERSFRADDRHQAFDGRARRWLDPDFVISWLRATGILAKRASAHGVSEYEQEIREREAVEQRRSRLARRRRGRRQLDERDARWIGLGLDYLEERLPARIEVTLPELLDAVRDDDWKQHAADWPRDRYPAADDDNASPSPGWEKKGRDRVREASGAQLAAVLADYHTLRSRR